jgi:2-methylcitrate dehydratase PrpD
MQCRLPALRRIEHPACPQNECMNIVPSIQTSPAAEMLERLSALSWPDLPPTAREHAVQCLMDNIGCGIFGAQFEWTKMTAQFVASEGSRGNASIFGGSQLAAPARAALVNGVAIHGYELDDIILGTLSHPGTAVAPAALAIAEHTQASPDRLLLGLIAGYETLARLGIVLAPHRQIAFHLTGIMGAVAAAVAASVVADLPFRKLNDAVGIACSRASGTKAFSQSVGGMVKRLHGGSAAETGVMACLLADLGFTGPLQAIDGLFGLIEAVCGDASGVGALSKDMGTDWAIERVWTKVYPCCGAVHTALQAIEQLRARENIAPAEVKTLRVATSRRGVTQNRETAPQDTMGAQYSLPFCAALAMTGDAKDPLAFAPENLQRPEILDMITKVELQVDPEIDAAYPDRLGNRVEITLQKGRKFEMTLWDAHGMPSEPCSPQELSGKFVRLCSASMDAKAIKRVLSVLDQFVTGGAVADLSASLRPQT